MLIIGICGASGSGKTTLAKELKARIHNSCIYLKQDCYYKDHSDMTFEERTLINYDEPAAFEHDVLYEDLLALRDGKSITAKEYDFPNHCRCDSGKTIAPPDVVLLEGIHVFYDPRVRDLMDLKIFIQVDPDVCVLRRVKRDIRERGRSIESVYQQYLSTVKPMYDRYIRGYAEYADLIVTHGGKNARITDMLAFYINSEMMK